MFFTPRTCLTHILIPNRQFNSSQPTSWGFTRYFVYGDILFQQTHCPCLGNYNNNNTTTNNNHLLETFPMAVRTRKFLHVFKIVSLVSE